MVDIWLAGATDLARMRLVRDGVGHADERDTVGRARIRLLIGSQTHSQLIGDGAVLERRVGAQRRERGRWGGTVGCARRLGRSLAAASRHRDRRIHNAPYGAATGGRGSNVSFAVVGTIDDGASSAACRIARGVGVVKEAARNAEPQVRQPEGHSAASTAAYRGPGAG